MENPKDLMVALPGKGPLEIPPLTVASLNLKTVINHKLNVNEIASISVVYCKRVKVYSLLQPANKRNLPAKTYGSLLRFGVVIYGSNFN